MASTAPAAAPSPPKVIASMNDLPRREFWTVVIAGFLLSLNAGFINASTMVGLFGTTVSHVTGTLTRIGVKSVQGEYDIVLRETLILLAFIFGAFIGGIILRNSKFKFTRRYGLALLAESFMLYMTAVAIYTGSYVAPMMGAFCCGLQNAVGTVYSAAILRTTHVTGTATDIGMILGQNLAIDVHHDLWKLYVLVPLLVGYFIGSVIGCAIYEAIDYAAFIFPATFVGIIGLAQLLLIQFRIVKYERQTKERYEAQRRARRAAHAAAQAPPSLQTILDERNQGAAAAAAAAGKAQDGDAPRAVVVVGNGTAAAAGSRTSIEMVPLQDSLSLFTDTESREGLLRSRGSDADAASASAIDTSTSVRV